jgi:hypothetical protein
MMFGWLSPSAKKASRPQPTARLGLERLETRDTPSTLTMSATYGLGSKVTLSGNLSGTSTPANQIICISGVASGMPCTDANGNFSITVQAGSLGEVDAQTMNGSSNVASVTLTDTAPQCFNFGAVPEGNNMWVFSGTVTWTHPFQSMQAQIQGPPPFGVVPVGATSNGTMNNGICTGTFSVCIQLNGQQSDNGNYIATATDFWGTQSNGAVECVCQENS